MSFNLICSVDCVAGVSSKIFGVTIYGPVVNSQEALGFTLDH